MLYLKKSSQVTIKVPCNCLHSLDWDSKHPIWNSTQAHTIHIKSNLENLGYQYQPNIISFLLALILLFLLSSNTLFKINLKKKTLTYHLLYIFFIILVENFHSKHYTNLWYKTQINSSKCLHYKFFCLSIITSHGDWFL